MVLLDDTLVESLRRDLLQSLGRDFVKSLEWDFNYEGISLCVVGLRACTIGVSDVTHTSIVGIRRSITKRNRTSVN